MFQMFDISSICDAHRATEQLAEQLMREYLHGIDKEKPRTVTIKGYFKPISVGHFCCIKSKVKIKTFKTRKTSNFSSKS